MSKSLRERIGNQEVEVKETKRELFIPLDIQFFAGEDDDDQDDDDSEDQDDDSDNQDDKDQDKDDKGKGEKDDKGKGKSFTQDQVTSMMAKEKKQGRKSLMKELGFANEKEMKEAMKAFKQFQDANKSKEEKDNEAKVEAENKLKEANQKMLIAEAKVEALGLGCKREFVDDIVTLALSKVDDDDEADFKTIIGELKAKYKKMFEEDDEDKDDKDKKGKKGTGSTIKNHGASSKGSKGGEKSLGERLAASKVKAKSKSLWANN